MPERLECEVLQKSRYINTLTFTFTFWYPWTAFTDHRTYHTHRFILVRFSFKLSLCFRIVDSAGYQSVLDCTLNTQYRIVSYRTTHTSYALIDCAVCVRSVVECGYEQAAGFRRPAISPLQECNIHDVNTLLVFLHYCDLNITLHYITVFSARPTTTRVGLAVQMSTMIKTRSVKIKSR